MFAAVMMPSALPMGHASPERLPAMPAFASSPFRPARPSPLSSSPIRHSSPPPLPDVSSSHHFSSHMDTQSSPIHGSQEQQPFGFRDISNDTTTTTTTTKKSLFRFASRPTKAVARGQQSRDAAQQTRRTLFLRNVRQRADDRSWDRRNMEQELQRMEWFSCEEELRRAREAEAADLYASQDLDEDLQDDNVDAMDNDAVIADLLAMEEEAEMERLRALEEEQATLPAYPQAYLSAGDHEHHQLSRQPSAHFDSDDGEYDDIFAEIASAVETEDTEMGCM